MADIADVAIPILTLLILVALTYSYLRSIRRLRDASLTGPSFYEAAGVDPDDVQEALEGVPAHQCPFVIGLNGVGVLAVRLPIIAIVRESGLDVIDSRDASFSVRYWALRSRIVFRWTGPTGMSTVAINLAAVDFDQMRVLMSDAET